MRSRLFFTALSLLVAAGALAQEGELKTKSISIFSNGGAYYQKEGSTGKDGVFVLKGDQIPQARFGTLWFSSDKPIEFVKSYVKQDTIIKNTPVSSISALLKANIGKSATLQGESIQLRGEIVNVDTSSDFVQIKSEEGMWSATKISNIATVWIQGEPSNEITSKSVKQENIIEMHSSSAKAGVPLSVEYLQYGLFWSPMYQMEVLDNKRIKLTLVAEVTNNAEDIVNTPINFVSGTPQFSYANKLSALVQPVKPQRVMSKSSILQNNHEFEMDEEMILISYEKAEDMSSQSSVSQAKENEVYTFGNLSLKSGERAHFDILSTTLDYKDLYVSHIKEANYQARQIAATTNLTFEITNNSKYNLISAPAFITQQKDGVKIPLAQNELSNTPIGAETQIRISEANRVNVESTDKVVEIGSNIIEHNDSRYRRYSMLGQITIKNNNTKSIDIKIYRTISGELTSSSVEHTVLSQSFTNTPNIKNSVMWELSVKPGQSITIDYNYNSYR